MRLLQYYINQQKKQRHMKFEEFDLSDELLDALDTMQFEECTPIQEQTIPVILEGNDLIACAQTGTGKTAAYLLPIIDRIAFDGFPADAINCLVISPTRELAQQIDRQMEGFSYYLPVTSLAVYGGTDGAGFSRQKHALKSGADVVISTPGRMIDHLRMGYVDLSQLSFFVLDEADRMLDMGFYDDIMRIVKFLPKDCQRLMFSATMPPKTRKLAESLLNDPVQINIAVSRPTDKINQSAYVCYQPQKTKILKHLFSNFHSKRVIVFAASKLNVKELTRELRKAGYKAAEMHSDLDQERRDHAMLDFKAGKTDILVATDILARGIDIDDISMVVNYDVPRETEDYIHRIGRTARANNCGMAVTLINEQDQQRFGKIESFLGYEVTKNDMPEGLGEAPEYRPERRGRQKPGNRNDRNKSRNKNRGKEKSVKAESAKTDATAAQNDRKDRRNKSRRRKQGGAAKQKKQEKPDNQ